VLLDGWRGVDGVARAHALVALRGAPAELAGAAEAAFVAGYCDDDSVDVRAAAAVALAERSETMDPALRGEALATARRDLIQADLGLADAAADVLGAPPLSAPDRAWLTGLAQGAREPGQRVLALRALAGAGVEPHELGSLLRDPRGS
jgi:hypothetical protein